MTASEAPTDAATPVRHPETDPTLPWRRVVAPAALAVVLQLALALEDRMPSIDGVAYLESGRNLFSGQGYVRAGHPELHFSPLIPMVLGPLARLTSDLTAVRILDAVGCLGLLAVIVTLAWRVTRNTRTTVVAAWLSVPIPGLQILLTREGGGSEAPAAALVLGAVALLATPATVDRSGPRTTTRPAGIGSLLRPPLAPWVRAGGAGALVGLAYLARPEMLLPGLAIGAFVAVRAWSRPDEGRRGTGGGLGMPIAFAAALLLCAGPYIVWLHGQTGTWSPTSKSKEVSVETWEDLARGRRLGRDLDLYALDPVTGELRAQPVSLLSLARTDPSGWRDVVAANLDSLQYHFLDITWRFGPSWQVLPALLLVPSAYGAFLRRRRRSTWLLLTLAALPVAATTLAFFVVPRYLVLTTAVIVVFAAHGVVGIGERLPVRARRPAAVALAVLLACTLLSTRGPGSPPLEQATAGRWIAAHSEPDDRVMTRSYHVQYAAGQPSVILPAAGYDEVLEFARRRGVRFIVADARTIRFRRPALAGALVGLDAPAGLRLVHHFSQEGWPVFIWELDPPAPPTDEPPLPVGYAGDEGAAERPSG